MYDNAVAKCPACGSVDIMRNITMSQAFEVGSTGLEYKKGVVLRAIEDLLADLCKHCGTVVRFHVKNPDRKWITKP